LLFNKKETVLIKKIRQYAGYYFLNRELKKRRRLKRPKSLGQIKTVGIIYMIPPESELNVISEFVKFFQDRNKTVKALGFTNTDLVPHYCFPKLTYDYYTKKNLNWYGKPSSKFVDDFIKNDFDIMIDISCVPSFSINYIGYMSVAGFKMGKLNDENLKHYDFMFNVPDDITLAEYTKQIKHYLTNININNE